MGLWADASGNLQCNSDGSIFDAEESELEECCCEEEEDPCMYALKCAIRERMLVAGYEAGALVDPDDTSYTLANLIAIVNEYLSSGNHFIDPDDNSWSGGSSLPSTLDDSTWASGATTCEGLYALVVSLKKSLRDADEPATSSSIAYSGISSDAETLADARSAAQSAFSQVSFLVHGSGASCRFHKNSRGETFTYWAQTFSPLIEVTDLGTDISHSIALYCEVGLQVRAGDYADVLSSQSQNVPGSSGTWQLHTTTSSSSSDTEQIRALNASIFPGDYDSSYEGTETKIYGFGIGFKAVVTWGFAY